MLEGERLQKENKQLIIKIKEVIIMTIETIQEKINNINSQLSKINNIRNQENISIFIDKEVYPTFKETFNNINFSGWRYDIETDLQEIWLTGALSQGSQSMSSWNGETFILCHIPMVQEPNENWFNIDDIDITQEEKERIESYLNIEIDELSNWVYVCETENIFAELYSEKYKKLFEEYIFNEWCYKKDALTDDIYNSLDGIENSLENELEELQGELHFIEGQKQA